MAPELVPVADGGLGNTTWLVGLGEGRALVVDASRDLRAVRAAAGERGWTVAYAADTHLHADFVTGAVDLAAGGAQLLASAAGGRAYGHRGLRDGDVVDLGGSTLRALGTPGHTDEHLAYLLSDGDRPIGVFTGGSLIVGAAARTDLVDPDRAEELARAQYASLRRLATLPDDVRVWPTHGAGSFCSAPPGAARSSSIGREKLVNPLLTAPDEDAFVSRLLGSLGTFPAYFRRLAEVNRRGPSPLPTDAALPPLAVERVLALRAAGAVVVDVRPPAAYAAGHVPGALAISLRPVFATWLGWLVPDPTTPLVFVRAAEQDPDEVVWQARKIGHDVLAGELAGGMTAWAGAGQPLATVPRVGPDQVDPARVLDVRQDREYAAGHLPAARHVELGALPDADLPPGPLVTMCAHGERATTAASVLERAGHSGIAVLTAGAEDWAKVTGHPLEATV
ncbi:MBL fold metallo-hydrolase [Geodermatophilus sp. YIM 151500]|uniref:MBL fold metallo-hydrolase n=1 Tax=Geodermatophilus sp. YIM 151500 TaxID=2984531 RepID=UPI0021E45673|nr:MBL fold metallo-hydrolase [Geodermatophilus sp. YIM 151500]MCV2488678.1 MBL fold metallo-hydrolase [Geodermatophilus sp. YIM 151500]